MINLVVLNWIFNIYLIIKLNSYLYIYYCNYFIYWLIKNIWNYNFYYYLIYILWFNSFVSVFYFKFSDLIWLLFIQKYTLYLYKSNNNVNFIYWYYQKKFN